MVSSRSVNEPYFYFRMGSPTFKCACPVGYAASFCELPAAANACNSDPCRNGGTCSLETLTQFKCTCPLGWTGETCLEEDPCAHSPCGSSGQCLSRDGGRSFSCRCPQGLMGDRCQIDVDECRQVPGVCGRHGQCRNNHGSYE